ncbi:hydrogenase, partial [bacterium]|nr:hydrogenase [bacterium]
MDLFLLSVILIISGGVVALLFYKRFFLMKGGSVILICAGCLLGLYSSVSTLNGETAFASFEYLHAFSLSFKVD